MAKRGSADAEADLLRYVKIEHIIYGSEAVAAVRICEAHMSVLGVSKACVCLIK